MNNMSIFDYMYPKYKITKPIRLIELFSGYGSQALALKYLGVNFEHWKTCEWAVKSIQAYKDIHFTDDNNDYSKEWKDEHLISWLFEKGISSNYNEPMKKEQIIKLGEEKRRNIFNNIYATHNLVNIQQVKGKDLDIKDTDKYEYIMTYSFPCQDLSLAGKGKGMADTSTRSGMLWEVERILSECEELPQMLLMENVPQVHSLENMKDFHKWQVRLEELGYKNYWQDLIATDYGIPQTRNRCFMISILGDYSYSFPKPIPLKLKLKNLLEDEVDEKYYLSDKMIEFFTKNEEKQKENGNGFRFNVSDGNVIAKTITTRAGARMDDNFIYNKSLKETLEKNKINNTCYIDTYNKAVDEEKARTITTGVDFRNNNFIAIKNATKQGYLEATDGDGIDISSRMQYHRGTVQKEMIQTLDTQGRESKGVVVNMKTELCNNLIKDGKVKENDVIRHSYTTSRMNGEMKDLKQNNLSPTLDTRCDCLGVVSSDLRIRKLTPKECFRLMGVKDEDYEKCAKNQSNASLYHLAGDSIVVNVLMEIFKEILKELKK